jgi:hypothetical protein
MFRRLLRAIFRGIFKQNFLLSWPSVRCVVKKLKTICSVSKRYIVNSFKF